MTLKTLSFFFFFLSYHTSNMFSKHYFKVILYEKWIWKICILTQFVNKNVHNYYIIKILKGEASFIKIERGYCNFIQWKYLQRARFLENSIVLEGACHEPPHTQLLLVDFCISLPQWAILHQLCKKNSSSTKWTVHWYMHEQSSQLYINEDFKRRRI